MNDKAREAVVRMLMDDYKIEVLFGARDDDIACVTVGTLIKLADLQWAASQQAAPIKPIEEMTDERPDELRSAMHGGVPVGVRADSAVACGAVPSLTDRLWGSAEVMGLNAELGLTMDQIARLSRAILSAAAPAQQAAEVFQPIESGDTLYLWKDGDRFLAYKHLYPCYSPGGDPMTLGEPFARAEFRASHDRAAAPTAQAERP